MLTSIRDEIDRTLFFQKLKEIDEFFERQSKLPKDARISSKVIFKLEELYQYLLKEIETYDKITDIE